MLEMAEHEEGVPPAAAEGIAMARAGGGASDRAWSTTCSTPRASTAARSTFSTRAADLVDIARGALTSVQPMVQRLGHDVSSTCPRGQCRSRRSPATCTSASSTCCPTRRSTPRSAGASGGGGARGARGAMERPRQRDRHPRRRGGSAVLEVLPRGQRESVETEGTGLGLYMVQLIATRMNGRVWCESELGQGTPSSSNCRSRASRLNPALRP